MPIIQTVLGPVNPDAIRNAMIHEHVLFDIVPPGLNGDREAEIELGNRWQIDYLSNEAAANSHQQDLDVAAAEMDAYREDGGALVVDQSVCGLARDPKGLVEVSRRSGVHIVAATGTYTLPYLDQDVLALGEEALRERFVSELINGMDETSIRAGIIGEIGCSWPMEPFERRALSAAAGAQRATGASISVHPGRHADACLEIVGILEREGADLSRVVLCHMDRTFPDGAGVLQLLEKGVSVEWDFFGIEQSHYWMGDVELPTDMDRLRLIGKFADCGYGSQLLISQDICTKTRMKRWGGHGYGHILRNVTALMRRLEFDQMLVEKLVRANPLRALSIQEEEHVHAT